jgi:outer membrane protein assembly factor BamB
MKILEAIRCCATVTAISCTLVLPASSLAGDWPGWRGADRDGISKESDLLKEWPSGGPPMLWKTAGLGSGYSTVAIAKGRIATMGDRDGSSFVVLLNEADGKVLWTQKIGLAGAPGWGDFEGPRSTPALDGDTVFALGQYGDLACLQTSNGTVQWKKNFKNDFGASLPEWGFSESPLVDGSQVVVTPGGSGGAMVALNKETGAILWRAKEFTDPAHYSSIIVADIDGVRQYIQLTERSVVGVAAKDGKLLWRAARRGSTAVIPTPVYNDHHVYVTSGYGIGCHLFRVSSAGGKFSAEEVYANKVMVNHHGGVVRLGNYVYGFSDSKGWTCQDFLKGEAAWQEKGVLGKGSIVYADGRLYLRTEEGKGTVALIEATPAGFKEKGRFDQPNRIDRQTWAHPVVANGRLYLRDNDILLCYDVKAK